MLFRSVLCVPDMSLRDPGVCEMVEDVKKFMMIDMNTVCSCLLRHGVMGAAGARAYFMREVGEFCSYFGYGVGKRCLCPVPRAD